MADVAFTLYKGFLIVEYSETDVKAYRSREYYAGNITSYEASSQALLSKEIDDAEDQGDFTDAGYYEMMRLLGRPEAAPTESIYPYDKGIERAAAYIAGLCQGREDVEDPTHSVWVGMEKEEYRDSYRRRARRVIELART